MQGSVISLYSDIHEDDSDLIPFILETKCDPRAKRLGNYSKASALFFISTAQLANHKHDSVPLIKRISSKMQFFQVFLARIVASSLPSELVRKLKE